MYLGIDLGTSAVKLLLINKAGDILHTVSKEYPLYQKGSWSEQNPEDWWNATFEGLKEIVSKVDKIQAISFSGQMHGLVLLDNQDQVIRPAILWNDQRTQEECNELNQLEKLTEETGNIALTGFTAPKLLWVKKNEPEKYERIHRIMLPKDYIAYKLSGIFGTDYSDASGMLLLDVANKKWSSYMLNELGINESQLPKLFESYEVMGTITEEHKKSLGITYDIKIVMGGGDQAVGAVGTGTVENNMCSISLGTSGVVFVANDAFKVDQDNALHAFCHSNGNYHVMGVMLSAAASIKWWTEEILKTKDYVKEQENIQPLGENTLYFLPYLTGERTPHNDPYARGTFVGITPNTTKEDMTQAVLEGVAYALRDMLEIVRSLGVDVTTARITGGGAKSKLWKQIIANVLNVTVDTIHSEEGPALGAAILAAVGDGAYANVEDATRNIIRVTGSILPDKALVETYNQKYPVFKEIYQNLKEIYPKLS